MDSMVKLQIDLERRALGSVIGIVAYDEITNKKKKIGLLIPKDRIGLDELPQKISVIIDY
ncbi:MAG: hypothetical protein M1526_04835 [Candidatus Thermoplasmatota archaeon]|jgi:hypothetical protein|nr:hypothetical protein [Candidatus Thermoplasmatota archaeon]MCL5681371.1 hypothetical protein [Candidatus Thermoplasmatota archaeon]